MECVNCSHNIHTGECPDLECYEERWEMAEKLAEEKKARNAIVVKGYVVKIIRM